MKLHTLTRTYILEKAGIDTSKIVAINGNPSWVPAMILPASGLPEKSIFIRSVIAAVDENTKRGHFLMMVDAIFSGMMLEDFSDHFANSVVKYKVAHSFKHAGKTENLRELKHGSKDRIYLYPYTGRNGRYVFFFEAAHKNQQHTEPGVKDRAEESIKRILADKFL
ncbi:hypothetical protein [Pseudomonas sp. 5P_5.1_Bac1]|uniref:hypothetical protein n=1 Tax=Pseudomonas sp. 5P_5.1_Bac1 TaxID=2971616 RepID=UPI0021C841CA|nr:hypothetical protein [Pseudomonas sp. 5P_5.1_Bac1]MCU1722398.1 hypothetical protein [Pseudomonas sp. 5P_5.1_Bac1]